MLAMDTDEIAWVSGFFDGEGCVTICKFKRKRYVQGEAYGLVVALSSTHLPALDRLHKHFGGSISKVRLTTGNKPYAQWRVTYRKAGEFLKVVRPYLMVKANQADVGIRFQETQKNWGPGGVPDDVYELQIKLRNQIRELNA